MRRFLPILAAAAAISCACASKDDETGGDVPLDEACPNGLTYQNFGQGFVQTWCLSCHSRTSTGDRRQCAPEGLNFDTFDEVQAWAALMDRKVSGDVAGPPPDNTATGGTCTGVPTAPACTCVEQSDMSMPPAGGISEEDAELLHEWVTCGTPGAPAPPPPCFHLVPSAGAVTFASQADADAFCTNGTNAVAGDLTISASVDATCLCAVDGTVSITGGASDISLPILERAGAIVAVAVPTLTRIAAPNLNSVALDPESAVTASEDLTLSDLPALQTLDLFWLSDVGGHATFSGLDALTDLPIGHLAVIGGDLTLDGLAAVTADLTRVRTVGGTLAITNNPALSDISSLLAVDTIGGDLVVSGNTVLGGLDIGEVLATLGGAVVIENNPVITGLEGFTLLQVAHEITISGNIGLASIAGFDTLTVADGITVAGNPNLLAVVGFENLPRVNGTLALVSNPRLTFVSFPLLGAADTSTVPPDPDHGLVGGLAVTGNDLGTGLLFPELSVVRGDLVVSDNSELATLDGLDALVVVEGALTIRDNPVLPTAAAEALASVVTVSGVVTISGNAP
ncbi:MAG: hypothetical protein H0V89_10525 [Deltaproteobacteria bacterium]|nr:hypothetical protein [Deltaproteobacteria bacterium]